MRRVRRIFPAALATIFLISVGTLFFANSLYRGSYLIDGSLAAAALANLRFLIEQRSYLASSTPPSPFIHFWSLGVEEQFYFVFPILLFTIQKVRRFSLLILTVLLFAFALWQASNSPLTYFYNPIARSWELLLGVCIAYLHAQSGFISRWKSKVSGEISQWINFLALITLTYFLFTPRALTPYSVVGALPVIVPGIVMLLFPAPLSLFSPLAYVGEISFSLYLIHWPVINFFTDKISQLSPANYCEILFIIALLTIILHYLVENPMRFRFAPKKVFLASLSIAIIFISGNLALANASFIKPTSSVTIDVSSPILYKDGCHLDGNQTWPAGACTFGDISGKVKWLLIGDSHAAQWFPAFEQIAINNHIQLTSITRSSCPALFIKTIRYQKSDVTCQVFQSKLAAFIAQHHFDRVFISNFTQQRYPLVNQKIPYLNQWISGTRQFINSAKISKVVTFIQDTPLAASNTVACLTANSSNPRSCDFPLKSDATFNTLKSLAQESGYGIIQTDQWLCTNGVCSATIDGHNTYRDATHISLSTAQELVPQLTPALHLR